MDFPEAYPVLRQVPVFCQMIYALLPEEWLKRANEAVEIGDLAGFECLLDNEIVVCREDFFCDSRDSVDCTKRRTALLK